MQKPVFHVDLQKNTSIDVGIDKRNRHLYVEGPYIWDCAGVAYSDAA